MNVTVYLGANYGTDPTLQTTVAELGQWIGKNGHTLVYGGSASGLMVCCPQRNGRRRSRDRRRTAVFH